MTVISAPKWKAYEDVNNWIMGGSAVTGAYHELLGLFNVACDKNDNV